MLNKNRSILPTIKSNSYCQYLQIKKREKHPRRSATFRKIAGFNLSFKVTLLHGCFSVFSNCANGTKSTMHYI